MDLQNKSGLMLIAELIRNVWPKVDIKLNEFENRAHIVKDKVLSNQALSSIKNKRFHALGGSVYAIYPNVDINSTISFITALQTISDYLDNLCDRAGIKDEAAFRQLHLAMLDAVDPLTTLTDYYLYYPYKDDNGYLKALVMECRNELIKLPSYNLVKKKLRYLAELYSSLQTYKHLDDTIRDEKLTNWAVSFKNDYPNINHWEFAASSGSTLCIFALFAAAHNPELTEKEVNDIYSAYFPYITSMHILLDYYIDSEEDKLSDDLNFVCYYKSMEECKQRLKYFVEMSMESCLRLTYPNFHLTVIRGLLAMYLSDLKAYSSLNAQTSNELIKAGGYRAVIYLKLCRLLRKKGKL